MKYDKKFMKKLSDAVSVIVEDLLLITFAKDAKDDKKEKRQTNKANKVKKKSPRKPRRDIGSIRQTGNGETVFYTPELVKMLDMNGVDANKHISNKIKSFNNSGEGHIEMPGKPNSSGYKADRDTWLKFFLMYS